MSAVFLSYRRTDSEDITGRIYEHLSRCLGAERVFRDIDSIALGVDFRHVLRDALRRCSVLLAVVGPEWRGARDDQGRCRLDQPDDFVRLEVEAALERGIPVIPVLVRGAVLPSAAELPETLKALVFRNATRVRPDPDFEPDMQRLLAGVRKHLALGESAPPAEPVPPAPARTPMADRSLSIGGSVSGSSLIAGDHNTVTVRSAAAPSSADRVDGRQEC